jgi:hypothetical protein
MTQAKPAEVLPAVPSRQALAIDGRSQAGRVTGKLKVALDAMVWEGKKRDEAAEAAGLKDASLRAALRKPHVKQHYNAELAALRTSFRAKNVHRLDNIAESSGNDMARVSAIKAMEALTDQDEAAGRSSGLPLPGLQIVILQAPEKPVRDVGEVITGVAERLSALRPSPDSSACPHVRPESELTGQPFRKSMASGDH